MTADKCHDCGRELVDGENVAPYLPEINGEPTRFYKCEKCYEADPILRDYMPCEVYTRVVGYLRPVSQMGVGKVQEVRDRKKFAIGGNRIAE